MTFEDLQVSAPLLKALENKGYTTPTPIQEKAIPLVLKRNDLMACAQTGTGKTAAFAIPIIQLIHQKDGNHQGKPFLRSLIVTPTRELAIQIDENIKEYAKHTNIRHTVVFGGVKQGKQVASLKNGVHILVATPGRLLDLINQGFIKLDKVKLFVLDEADRMLDMGFINDIKKLIKLLPKERQSLFFSATMPDNIIALSRTILNNPKKVEVAAVSSTADTIQQYVYYTNKSTKNQLLLHILENKDIEQVLIFTRTKHGADRVVRNLKKSNINAAAIHGDKAQNARQRALRDFKEGKVRVLVATDIAARGIDIDKLRYVINYEISNVPESYVHRIGRSGRAGEDGISIALCEPEENEFIREIQKLIGKKIEVINDNPFPQTEKPMTEKEKKEWNKEKQRKKQEFFANRKANKANGGGGRGRGGNNKPKNKSQGNQSSSRSEKGESTKDDSRSSSSNRNQSTKKNSQGGNSKRRSEGNGSSGENNGNNKSKKKHNHKKKTNKRSTGTPQSLKDKYKWPTLE